MARRAPRLLLAAGLLLAAPRAALLAEDATPTAADQARKAALENIRRDLRKWSTGPRAIADKPDVLKALESLEALGGPETARVALEAVALDDKEVRDRAFAIVDKEHPKSLVKTLSELVDEKRYRRDFDVHRRVARTYAVIGDVSGVEPLVALVESEDPQVVAAAAESLATFSAAPHRVRLEPVRRLIDKYEGTWNLAESMRPEDRVISRVMKERWDVYGKPIRAALQALTKATISRPAEWRRWWNDNKKKEDW
jgi:hypothetical protein